MATKLMKLHVSDGKVIFKVTVYHPDIVGYVETHHTSILTAIAELSAVIENFAGVTCSLSHYQEDGSFDCIVLSVVS